MNVTIFPSRLSGTVKAPPSKSMAHRLLIAAGLAHGTSRIEGIADSEDVSATLDLLTALGAECHKQGNVVTLTGIDPRHVSVTGVPSCRECGSTLRFFIPLCLLSDKEITLSGSERLFARPLGIYEDICHEQDLTFRREATSVTLKGPLKPGTFTLRGDVSSQFISGLLFALPLLGGNSTIRLLPPVESRSYIDMTLDALATFGVRAKWQNELTLTIPDNQTYTACNALVEGDYSNAAFFLALRTLGMDVTVTDLPTTTRQGDSICKSYLNALDKGTPTLSIGDCPDLGPILMAVAAAKHGCILTDTGRLAIKESDRGAAMAEELAKFGVKVDRTTDTITVHGGTLRAPTAPLSGHNDHRIVMSLATLCTLVGGTIEGAEAVRKSLPDYFDSMKSLGLEMNPFEA